MALGMMEKVTMVLEEAANPVPMEMPMAAPSRSSSPFDILGHGTAENAEIGGKKERGDGDEGRMGTVK